jgi:copper(I)-binding protein
LATFPDVDGMNRTSAFPAGLLPPRIFLSGVFFSGMLLSCGGEEPVGRPDLATEGQWIRAMPLMQGGGGAPTNSAAYLTIMNHGGAPGRLVGAETPRADRVEIHESFLTDDVMRMRQLDGLDIPAGGSVELAPGGTHLMLMGLTQPLVEGEEVELILRFQRSGDLAVTAPVRAAGEG